MNSPMSPASSELGFFLDNQSLTTSETRQVQEAFKTSSWKRSLTSRVMLRLPMSMSGSRTKPGLVNKIRLPDCGPGVAVAPSYSATTIPGTSISSVPSAPATGTTEAFAQSLW